MIPTSVKEVKSLGWDYIDVILFTGDAFIDHPSFGTAVIARWLQKYGYRVAVVPQPNWRDDLRDFRKLGAPRLYFGVNSGAMDSMVNHYTAAKRLRSDDAYTPDGKAGQRPDYAVTVYTKILKQIYPDIPVLIGGIEASLRRVTHYDYWQDALKPSILVDSGADWLCYGMGERTIIEFTKAIEAGRNLNDIRKIPQLGFYMDGRCKLKDAVILNSYERCCKDKVAFAENFHIIETYANMATPPVLVEPVGKGYVQINTTWPPATQEEMDSFWDLPFTKQPHPRYKGKHSPAFEMIKFSINTHRPISSAPIRKLRDAVLFSVLPFCSNTAVAVTLPIGLESQVSSPREFHIITSLTESDIRAITLMILLSFARISFSSSFRKGRKLSALRSRQFC